MRWKGRRQSSNVEDRRGESVPAGRRGMGIAGGAGIAKVLFSLLSRSSGKTRIVIIIIAVIGFVLFKDKLLGTAGGQQASSGKANVEQSGKVGKDDEHRAFISAVLGANEDIWKRLYPQTFNSRYEPAKLVIYNVGTKMGGGSVADARMGPFYLPFDKTIYLDPSFFTDMEQKFGVEGDFARAYVISHEFGHHLQTLMGRTQKLHSQHGKISKTTYNQESVRLELHADFLAGIFAHHDDKNFNSLDQSDIQEAIRCAKAIGDDRLQQQAGGTIRPDHFTHGTSEQRAKWFMAGYTSGDPRDGEQIYSMPYTRL